MIPKHISFSFYKYFESIKNLRQNGQILSFFHFSSLENMIWIVLSVVTAVDYNLIE